MGSSFCPKCGTPRVGAFRYCRSCQFDFEEIGGEVGVSGSTSPIPTAPAPSSSWPPPPVGGGTPAPSWPAPSVPIPARQASNTLSWIAIACGAVAFLFFPIVFSPLGIVLAAIAYTRGEARWAVGLAVAVVGGIVGFMVGYLVAVS